MNVIPETRAL